MKRVLMAAVLVLSILLLSSAVFASKNPHEGKSEIAKWGGHQWVVKLKDGRLSATGRQGSWKDSAYLVDTGVTKFWSVGTGIGLVVIYQQGNLLYAAQMDGLTGKVNFRDKFHKSNILSIKLTGENGGALLHIEKPNKDILVVSVNENGYKYLREIKYQD